MSRLVGELIGIILIVFGMLVAAGVILLSLPYSFIVQVATGLMFVVVGAIVFLMSRY